MVIQNYKKYDYYKPSDVIPKYLNFNYFERVKVFFPSVK